MIALISDPLFSVPRYLRKEAARIIFKKDRLCHSQPLLKNLNALNVYQINLHQNLKFMHRIKMGNILKVFHETIKKSNHKHPTAVCNLHYSIKKYSLKSTKYSVFYRGLPYGTQSLIKEIRKFSLICYLKRKLSQGY